MTNMDAEERDFPESDENEGHVGSPQSPSMDNLFSNRQVLERRLKYRLEREDLVVRGIMPPHNTAPSIAAQVTQLERAKTGDFLQKKIRFRPSKQVLVQRHILSDSKVDASLQAKQASLERNLIADSLNEHLFNRPGPLELIQENILETEPQVANVVRHGEVSFQPTRDEVHSPDSSERLSPTSELEGLDGLSGVTDNIDIFSQAFSEHVQVGASKPSLSTEGVNFPNAVSTASDTTYVPLSSPSQSISKPVPKDTTIKKLIKPSKKKQQQQNKPKIKKYKYHEYKPPNATPASYEQPLDSRYKRLLEQQQLYLQLQVMQQNALAATLQQPTEEDLEAVASESQTAADKERPVTSTCSSTSQSHTSQSLDDLRVIDLRSQLKQRGLPVSGPKAKLIERLKNHEEGKLITENGQPKTDQNSMPVNINSVSSSAVAELPGVVNSTVAANVGNVNPVTQVTAYQTTVGQTYQVVQAVRQQVQYQVIADQNLISKSQPIISPVQLQPMDVSNPVSQTAQVVSIAGTPLSSNTSPHIIQGSPGGVIYNQNPSQVQYVQQVSPHMAQLQFQFSPPGQMATDQAQQISPALLVQRQQSSPARIQADPFQTFQLPMYSSSQPQPGLLSTSATSFNLQNQPTIVNGQVQGPQTVYNVQQSNHQAQVLMQQLQQVQNSFTGTPNNQQLQEVELTSRSTPASPQQYMKLESHPWTNPPIDVPKNSNDNSFLMFKMKPDGPKFQAPRGRSHTAPASSLKRSNMPNQGSHSNNGTSKVNVPEDSRTLSQPVVVQQNGTVVVLDQDRRIKMEPESMQSQPMNTMFEDENDLNFQQINNAIKNGGLGNDDLLDILGEMTGDLDIPDGVNPQISSHQQPLYINTSSQVKVEPNPSPSTAVLAKQRNLHNLIAHHSPKGKIYGSLPGDLNLLGSNIQPLQLTSGVSGSLSASGSYGNIPASAPEGQHPSALSHSKSRPIPPKFEDSAPSPMNIDDDHSVDMETYSTGSSVPSQSDLDWLNLSFVPASPKVNNTQNLVKQHMNSLSKEMSLRQTIGGFSLDANPNSLFGSPRTQDLSLFDLEQTHSLIMAVDGHDDKWDLY